MDEAQRTRQQILEVRVSSLRTSTVVMSYGPGSPFTVLHVDAPVNIARQAFKMAPVGVFWTLVALYTGIAWLKRSWAAWRGRRRYAAFRRRQAR